MKAVLQRVKGACVHGESRGPHISTLFLIHGLTSLPLSSSRWEARVQYRTGHRGTHRHRHRRHHGGSGTACQQDPQSEGESAPGEK